MFFSRHGEAELRQITLTMTPIPLELRYQRRLVCHIFIDFCREPVNYYFELARKKGKGGCDPFADQFCKVLFDNLPLQLHTLEESGISLSFKDL